MAKSRKRGGQKAHNQRIKTRNQKIWSEQRKMQEKIKSFYEEKLAELKNQSLENELSVNLDDKQIPISVVDSEIVENSEQII